MPNTSTARPATQDNLSCPYSIHLAANECRTIYRALALVRKAMVQHKVVIGSPGAVRDYLKLDLALEEREVFVCLWLDAQNRLIEAERMFVGSLTQTSVYPREIVKTALRHNAAAVILAHNHPSGSTRPSSADVTLTCVLKDALEMVDVRVHDHFIVGDDSRPLSFREFGLMPFGDLRELLAPVDPPVNARREKRARRGSKKAGAVVDVDSEAPCILDTCCANLKKPGRAAKRGPDDK